MTESNRKSDQVRTKEQSNNCPACEGPQALALATKSSNQVSSLQGNDTRTNSGEREFDGTRTKVGDEDLDGLKLNGSTAQ